MESFLGFSVLIFGVLNLILFFKIWGMTNNVKKLTRHFASDSKYEGIATKIRLAKMQGRTKEQIQLFLADSMAKEIMENYSCQTEEIIKKWEQIFKRAEIDVPDYLKQIKTYKDVINLYHEKEWDEVLNS